MRESLICSLFLLIALCGAVSAAEFIRLTVLYDNYLYNESLHTAWGLACLVEVGKRTVLFDTGEDAETLLSNMAALGIAPHRIEIVVLSHIRSDHVGGLFSLLELNHAVRVYLPAAFPSDFKERIRAYGALGIEVQEPMELVPGVWSTGEMETLIKEQVLVVQTSEGLVVITGCAHSGVVNMVTKVKELAGGGSHLVIGGFHMSGMSQKQNQEAYGNAFYPVGAGWSIELSPIP